MQLATQGDVPPVEAFESIACPLECVRELTAVAKAVGYRFPPAHAALRRLRLHQAKQQAAGDRFPTWAEIAERVGLHRSRIYQLVTETKPGPGRIAPNPAPICAAAAALPPASGSLESSQDRKTAAAADLQANLPTATTSGESL